MNNYNSQLERYSRFWTVEVSLFEYPYYIPHLVSLQTWHCKLKDRKIKKTAILIRDVRQEKNMNQIIHTTFKSKSWSVLIDKVVYQFLRIILTKNLEIFLNLLI